MRIIAGRYGGRRLAVPPGSRTRPTSDRVREALFASLGGAVVGARFLDLYAGTGAVGLEALSRGAAAVTFVESDARALTVLRRNLAALSLRQDGAVATRVVAGSAERFLAEPPPQPDFDIAVLDPPYALDLSRVLALLVPWVSDAVVVERATRDGPLTWPDGLVQEKARRYGDTTLWYGCRS